MQILHISDLHLGKVVNGFSMIEEQRHCLNQVENKIKTDKIQWLVIAGDVYDRSIPPAVAVELFDQFITNVTKLGAQIAIINGNHDGSSRLNFASKLLAANNVYIASDDHKLIDYIDTDEVRFHLISYKVPALISKLTDSPIGDFQAGFEKILETVDFAQNKPNIAVVHGYLISGADETTASDSERPLAIGGSEFVNSSIFKQYDAVLAGHLHRHQHLKPNVYYSGSICPYSFSETNNNNGYYLLTIDGNKIDYQYHSFELLRKFEIIHGSLEQLIKQPANDNYILARLTDIGGLNNPLEKLRQVFPNIMQIERLDRTRSDVEVKQLDSKSYNQMFADFYNQVSEIEITTEQQAYIDQSLEQIIKEES